MGVMCKRCNPQVSLPGYELDGKHERRGVAPKTAGVEPKIRLLANVCICAVCYHAVIYILCHYGDAMLCCRNE